MHSAEPHRTPTPGRITAALLTAGLLAGSALVAAAPAGAASPRVVPNLCENHSQPNGFSADIPPGTVIKPNTGYGGGAYGSEKLVMQADGNLVLYLTDPRTPTGPALWSTATWGHPGAYAVQQQDGNLVVYRKGTSDQADALWNSRTWGHPGAYLLVQDDANTVVYKPGGGPTTGGALWATGTYGQG